MPLKRWEREKNARKRLWRYYASFITPRLFLCFTLSLTFLVFNPCIETSYQTKSGTTNVSERTNAEVFPREFCDSFTSHNTESFLRNGINMTANQRLSFHSRETRRRLTAAWHRRLFPRFYLRRGGRLYTCYWYSFLVNFDLIKPLYTLTPTVRVWNVAINN